MHKHRGTQDKVSSASAFAMDVLHFPSALAERQSTAYASLFVQT